MSSITANHHSRRGSLWNKWDLHLHTPASYDYAGGPVTDQQIVDQLVSNGVRVVAITDHHTMDVCRIRKLQELGRSKLTVLPGVELRDDHGGSPIHYICLFAEDCDLDHVWTMVQGSLSLTPVSIKAKGGDDRIYVPIEDGARVTRTLGGLISIHAGRKSNSIEGIKNKEEFQRQIKFDITRDHVDLMEIGQIRDISEHWTRIFPVIGLEKPLVIGSDNHNICDYSYVNPLWIRADPCFRGLKMVIREPRDRVYIGQRPSSLTRVEQNPTKYIRRVAYTKAGDAPTSEQWFSGEIYFNSGLVAIIGNKGSGKSALADTLGLLGSSKNSKSFSFLNNSRFRHATLGKARHFSATLEWESGKEVRRCLNDDVGSEEAEFVKYLPQDYVETVCTELTNEGEGSFEQELKSVIFSHVPETQRLNQSTLDALIQFQTDEKQRRVDSLIRQLRELSRSRAALEAQADPNTKQTLVEKLNQLEAELVAHNSLKPQEVPNPIDVDSGEVNSPVLQEIERLQQEKLHLERQIAGAETQASSLTVKKAVAQRLTEKLTNFEKDYNAFLSTLTADAATLGLQIEDLVGLSISTAPVTQAEVTIQSQLDLVNKSPDLLDTDSLPSKLDLVDDKLI